MSKTRRILMFDLYGTLVDIQVNEEAFPLWERVASVLRGLGRNVTPDATRNEYRTLCAALERKLGAGRILNDVFRAMLGASFQRSNEAELTYLARTFRRESIQLLAVRDYAVPLLCSLRKIKENRLALVSNTEDLLTDFDLDYLGIRGFFDHIALSSTVGAAKPDVALANDVLRKLCGVAEEVVVIGDTHSTDIRMAERMGTASILLDQNVVRGHVMRKHAVDALSVYPDGISIRLALADLNVKIG
jgi:putative hydrolase of the HAD superfamily